jgi:putative transposase
MIKAYRYQLRLKGSQEASLKRWSGALRWLWNRMIAEQQAGRARGEKYANYIDMAKWLTAWRSDLQPTLALDLGITSLLRAAVVRWLSP